MEKTVVVKVEREFLHPRVKKYMKASRKYKVHDENEQQKLATWLKFMKDDQFPKLSICILHRIINPSASMEQGE